MMQLTPIRIPRAIWLHAKRIEVEMVPTLMFRGDELGHAAYRENKIRIQQHEGAYPRSQQDIERTFLHELVHWILHRMGEQELQGNEQFVDVFASLLQQAFVMAEYDDA